MRIKTINVNGRKVDLSINNKGGDIEILVVTPLPMIKSIKGKNLKYKDGKLSFSCNRKDYKETIKTIKGFLAVIFSKNDSINKRIVQETKDDSTNTSDSGTIESKRDTGSSRPKSIRPDKES